MSIPKIIVSHETIGTPPYLLVAVSESFEYENGKRTTKLKGYMHKIVLPKRCFEPINILTPYKTIDVKDEPIEVTAENLRLSCYIKDSRIVLRGEADAIKPFTNSKLKMRVAD